jgi:hypothetical protein
MSKPTAINLAKKRRIDLGLAISAATLAPGQSRSQKELAAFTTMTPQGIAYIEHNAIAKIRAALRNRYGYTFSNREEIIPETKTQ